MKHIKENNSMPWKIKLAKELNNQVHDKGLEMTIRKLIFRNCNDEDIKKAMCEYMPEYCKDQSEDEELDLKENNSSDTYDRRDIVDYVIKYATDRDRYFNISCAYDSDVSTSDSKKTVERLISEFVDDDIIDELTGEYDYTDETYDLIQDNLDDLKHIDDYFKDYGKKQNSIWQSEKDELNREYRRSQGF